MGFLGSVSHSSNVIKLKEGSWGPRMQSHHAINRE